MCRLYANTTPFHIEHPWLLVSGGIPRADHSPLESFLALVEIQKVLVAGTWYLMEVKALRSVGSQMVCLGSLLCSYRLSFKKKCSCFIFSSILFRPHLTSALITFYGVICILLSSGPTIPWWTGISQFHLCVGHNQFWIL